MRFSGCPNTACGNNTMAYACLVTAMRMINQRITYHCLVDGDDCVLLLERKHLDEVVTQLKNVYLHFGHEIKLEGIHHMINSVQWCQCRPCEFDTRGPTMVRDWRKVVSCALVGIQRFDRPKLQLSCCFAIGLCELALHSGVPIIQAFALKLISISNMKPPKDVSEYEWARLIQLRLDPYQARARAVEYTTRLTFAAAWGVSPDDQISIEKIIAKSTIPLGKVHFEGPIFLDQWCGAPRAVWDDNEREQV